MTEEVTDMRTVFADPDDDTIIMAPVYGGQATLDDVARQLRAYPGVGKPFFAFTSIPPTVDANIAADFTDAPLITASLADNVTLINQMLADAALQDLPNSQVHEVGWTA
jgi:hypothetical protein